LVASPLNYPSSVFKLLCSDSFQESCNLDIDKLAIAYLPLHSYGTSEEFVHRVLEKWNVVIGDVDNQGAQMENLEDALEILEEEGRTPIILLPKFHKTIEKLSWALGAQLRDLEANYGLCTVVELPVPMSRLRERWEMIEEKEAFICSDFGQGHSMISLSGFQLNEVAELVKNEGLSDDYVKIMQQWSGGMPDLVRWLIREAQFSKSTTAFESLVRKGCVEQSKLFLKWLDAPSSDYYKARVSALWKNTATEEERAEVRDHDWHEILIDRDGHVRSAVIGFACTKSIGGDYYQSLASIAAAVAKGNKGEVDGLVRGLSDACRAEKRLKQILAIVPVWQLATKLSPDFKSIEIASKRAENQLGSDESESAKEVKSVLRRWHNFAKGVNNFSRLADRKKEQGWELSDCLSGREGGSTMAAIQLVLYRLYEAEKIQDSNVALKSVLEIPEQILQIYCGRKLGISVWETPDFPDEVINSVRDLWIEGKYRVPVNKSSLAFVDMLYIGWVLMSKLDEKERLFQELSEIESWRETYDDIRNKSSHSITFETEKIGGIFIQNV